MEQLPTTPECTAELMTGTPCQTRVQVENFYHFTIIIMMRYLGVTKLDISEADMVRLLGPAPTAVVIEKKVGVGLHLHLEEIPLALLAPSANEQPI